MTDRPHTFTLRTSDDRRLAAALVAHASVLGVELGDGRLTVRTSQLGAFALAIPTIARDLRRHRCVSCVPTDESLEDVFAYLVNR